jgi:hypothetical protein
MQRLIGVVGQSSQVGEARTMLALVGEDSLLTRTRDNHSKFDRDDSRVQTTDAKSGGDSSHAGID